MRDGGGCLTDLLAVPQEETLVLRALEAQRESDIAGQTEAFGGCCQGTAQSKLSLPRHLVNRETY